MTPEIKEALDRLRTFGTYPVERSPGTFFSDDLALLAAAVDRMEKMEHEARRALKFADLCTAHATHEERLTWVVLREYWAAVLSPEQTSRRGRRGAGPGGGREDIADAD